MTEINFRCMCNNTVYGGCECLMVWMYCSVCDSLGRMGCRSEINERHSTLGQVSSHELNSWPCSDITQQPVADINSLLLS